MSMYTGRPTADKVLIARVIIAFLLLILCGNQIYWGIRMVMSNAVPPTVIVNGDYSKITSNEEVQGTIDNIVYEYHGDDVLNGQAVRYYLSKTSDRRLISIRVIDGSQMDSQLNALKRGEIQDVDYRGRVHDMKDLNKSMLNLQIIADRVISLNDVDGGTQYAMVPYVIDVVDRNATIDTRSIVFTFVGAALALIAAFLVIRKPLKLIIESYRLRKGTYESERKVTLDDLVFENEGYYEGLKEGENEFFVNTEYNIRNEGDTEAIRDRREADAARSEGGSEADKAGSQADGQAQTKPEPQGEISYYKSDVSEDGNFFIDDKPGGYRRRY